MSETIKIFFIKYIYNKNWLLFVFPIRTIQVIEEGAK